MDTLRKLFIVNKRWPLAVKYMYIVKPFLIGKGLNNKRTSTLPPRLGFLVVVVVVRAFAVGRAFVVRGPIVDGGPAPVVGLTKGGKVGLGLCKGAGVI